MDAKKYSKEGILQLIIGYWTRLALKDSDQWLKRLTNVIISHSHNKLAEFLQFYSSVQYHRYDPVEGDQIVTLNANGSGWHQTSQNDPRKLWEETKVDGTWNILDDNKQIVINGRHTYRSEDKPTQITKDQQIKIPMTNDKKALNMFTKTSIKTEIMNKELIISVKAYKMRGVLGDWQTVYNDADYMDLKAALDNGYSTCSYNYRQKYMLLWFRGYNDFKWKLKMHDPCVPV